MLNVFFSEHLNFTSTFLRSYTQATQTMQTVATKEKLYQDNGIWLMIPNITVCTVDSEIVLIDFYIVSAFSVLNTITYS